MEEGPALALPRVITCSSGGRPSVPSLCWGMLLLKRYFTRTTHAHSPISLNDHMLESPLHFDAFSRFSFPKDGTKDQNPRPLCTLCFSGLLSPQPGLRSLPCPGTGNIWGSSSHRASLSRPRAGRPPWSSGESSLFHSAVVWQGRSLLGNGADRICCLSWVISVLGLYFLHHSNWE